MTQLPEKISKLPEKISKLPKWAQQHIQVCHANIRNLEQQAAQMTQGPKGSKVRLVRFAGDLEDQPLPDRTIVAFDTDDNGYIEVRLMDGGIYISGLWALSIEPSASNCATIRLKDRKRK